MSPVTCVERGSTAASYAMHARVMYARYLVEVPLRQKRDGDVEEVFAMIFRYGGTEVVTTGGDSAKLSVVLNAEVNSIADHTCDHFKCWYLEDDSEFVTNRVSPVGCEGLSILMYL